MTPDARGALGRHRWSIAVGLLSLAVYMLMPALTSTHVEGYTAALQFDAIAAHRHLIARADLLYPIQTEYLYLTRQGVALLLRGLMQLTGSTGDGLFRGLTIVSLAVFLATTASVARRHVAIGWGATLTSLLLLPGLFELGFYFNDNLIAAAFGTSALALLPKPGVAGRAPAWLGQSGLAGIFFGMAVLCRADALLMLPIAMALAWLDSRRRGEWVLLYVTVAIGMILAFATAQVLSGTTLLQALQIGHFFDTLHATVRIVFVRSLVFLFFFGIPGLVLVTIGAFRTYRMESVRRRLVLLALPGALLVFALRSSTEVRQIYPYLTPFAVMLCARGLQWAAHALSSRHQPGHRQALALLAGTALVWLLPPVFVPIKDGPRTPIGRFWSPPMWRTWQGRVEASLDDVDALIAMAEKTPRLGVITAHFNSDHYLQLRAWQRGWVPMTSAETAERCGVGVEVWRKGDHDLIQIRLDNTYGLSGIDTNDFMAIHLAGALACPSLAGIPVYVSDFWPALSAEPLVESLRAHLPSEPRPALSFGWPEAYAIGLAQSWGWRSIFVPLLYGINRSGPLLPDQLRVARRLAEERVALALPVPPARVVPTLQDLLPHFAARYWKPPPLGAAAPTQQAAAAVP